MGRALTRQGRAQMRKRTAVPRRAAVSVLVATLAVMATVPPDDTHAFAWKDICQIGFKNLTGSYTGLQPVGGILPEVPPSPIDEYQWERLRFPPSGVPLGPDAAHPGGGVKFQTIGFPVTFGCAIHPSFRRGKDLFRCDVVAPSSGRNTFQCVLTPPGVTWQMTKDNDDIAGIVTVGPAPAQASGLQASSAAVASVPKMPAGGSHARGFALRSRPTASAAWRGC